MNLDQAYRVTLYDAGGAPYFQYIEAESLDEAVAKAKKTFSGRLYGLGLKYSGSEVQKACASTPLQGRILFGFSGGHITLTASNHTIYEMLELAKGHNFVDGKEITEISSPLSLGAGREEQGLPKRHDLAGRQSVLPGAEEASDKQLIEHKMQGRIKPKRAQKELGHGLFDNHNQLEML